MSHPASHVEYRRAGPADAEAFVRLMGDPEVYSGHRAYTLRNGVYVDAHAMARLHPHPPQLPKA
ncbi:MAG TPA: hypothetical protein VFR86_10045 [Burkholderiaceae bacterium]|nr:hypothetical protein [Burkholderiaceae bacterium]